MLVKICGITTREAALTVSDAGADFIGFVFAPSKRKIEPQQAAEIAHALPPSIKKTGVFVNETLDNIIDIASIVGLDVIQLHGDEPPELAEKLPYEVIKAFSIDRVNNNDIENYPCDYYLIDSPPAEHRGGSGQTFNWALVQNLPIDREKVILAGGLSPENVHLAKDQVQPIGVDVSSGVETEGKKDLDKIKQFIENAKG